MRDDRKSGASLLAFLVAALGLIGLLALVGGRRAAIWMANGGLGYLLGVGLAIGILFGALWLIRKRD